MPRRPRCDAPGSWHHVVNRAIAKRPYFEVREDQRTFLSRLALEVRAGRLEVHAYCLMTTHFHLLVRSPVGELSEAMRRAQCAYSRFFNRKRHRDGSLIRARFHSKRIDSDAYWSAVVRYIDENPVRAGLARAIGEYEFSSARAYLGQRRPPWLSIGAVEARALACSGSRRFSAQAYLRAFGPRAGEDVRSLCELVESRLKSAREVDPLEDLVGATPDQVRAWMCRKAALADGMQVGLPVCGPSGLRRALDLERARGGEWFAECDGELRRGSDLAWIALLHELCALPLARIAALAGRTVWGVRTELVASRSILAADAEHTKRVARVVAEALAAVLPPAPRA